MLKIFDITKSIRIKIDTLNLVIKIYLNQKHKNKQYLVIYYSRKLLLIKQNYNIHNKKLLTIVTTLKN